MKNPAHTRLSLHLPRLSLCCAYLAALPAAAKAAADTTWSGLSGGGAQWSDATNWSGGIPSGSSRAVFGTGFGSGAAVTLNGMVCDVESMRLDTTSSFSLEGGTLRLATGGLTRTAASAGNQVLYTPVQLSSTGTSDGSPAVWDVKGSDALYLYGNVATAGRPWQVNGGIPGAGSAPFWFGGTSDGLLSVSGEVNFFGGATTASLQATAAGLSSPGTPLRVTGNAETVLTNSTVRSLVLDLTGSSLRETGTTFTDGAGLVMSPPANLTTRVLGDGLTGLNFFTKNGAGTVRLEANGATALETKWFYPQSGTVDLDGRTLRVTGPTSGDATLTLPSGFTLEDSATGGKLRMEYMSLQNNGATFSGTPDLTFAPPAGVLSLVQGAGIAGAGGTPGVGELRLEGAGTFRPLTQVFAESLSIAAGPVWHAAVPVVVRDLATFEAGSRVDNVGGSFLEMRGGQIKNHGAILTNGPALAVNNPAPQTVFIAGSAPLTGVGTFAKVNTGTLVLQQNVQATFLSWGGSSGTIDLNDHTFTASGPAGSGVTLNLNSGSTLTDSGTAGTLRFERSDLRNNGAALTGTPNMTFAPPSDVQAVIQGNALAGPGGAPALGRLRVEGTGAFRAVTLVSAEEFSLASGPLFQAVNAVAVSSLTTLESGSRIEGFGGNTALELRGGQFLNNGASLLNLPSLAVNNIAAQPVVIGGSAATTGLGALIKAGAGTLTLQQDVQANFLYWNGNGGTVDLNDHVLTVSGPPGGGYSLNLYNGCTLTDNGTGGALRFVRADLINNGAAFTNTPSLTFAPAADVQALIQGTAITGPAGAPAVGRLRVEGTGTFRALTAVSAEEFSLAAGPLFQAGVPVAVRDQATLENGSRIEGFGGIPALEMRGGPLTNNGVTLQNSPALVVNNPNGQPVTIKGSAALTGLGSLQKASAGALILEQDVSTASLQHGSYGGTIDLHSHVLETTNGGLLAQGSTLVDNTGNGLLRLTRGNLFIQTGSSRVSEPDLDLAAAPLQETAVSTGDLIATGFGTLFCSGSGTNNLNGNLGVSRAEFTSGTTRFASTVFVSDEVILGPSASLTSSALNSGIYLDSARLRSEGASLSGSLNLVVNSTGTFTAGRCSIEGPAPLAGVDGFSITGVGHTDISVTVSARVGVLSSGVVDLHGQALNTRYLALRGGVQVKDSTGGASILSFLGDPVELGEGRCEVPITTTSGALKTGNNTMTLAAGSLGWFGDVVVIAGTLAQDADLATGNAPIRVESGAVYAGHGRTGGSLTLQSGAHLAPGNPNTVSAGVFTLAQPLTLNAGTVLDFDLGTPVTGSDRIVLESYLSSPASGAVTVNITRAPGYTNNGTSYVLLDVTAAGGAGLNLSQFVLGKAPVLGTLALGSDGTTLIFQPAVDSDGDGILDSWEMANFNNLTTATATSDTDHDGLSDQQEYAGGFDPNDPASRLEIIAFLSDPFTGLSAVSFTSRAGHLYREESSLDLETWYSWSETQASDMTSVTPYNSNITDNRAFRRILAVPPEI